MSALRKINVAMVGTGLMLELISKDLQLAENIIPKIIYSRDKSRGREAADIHGFEESDDNLERVLSRSDVDLIYIATPHSAHLQLGKMALDAGKPILVEKSMTPNAGDTRELCEYAREKKLFAMEAMWPAFNPTIIESIRRVKNGDLGDELRLSVNMSMVFPYLPDSRLWDRKLAAGTTLDQGVYTYSLAHMYFGEPRNISANGIIRHDIDAEVETDLTYADSSRAHCFNGLLTAGTNDASMYGSKGFLRLDANFTGTTGFDFVLRTKGKVTHQERFTSPLEGRGYVPMLRAVGNAVLNGQLEHELRTHKSTIEVAEIMDEVLMQVSRKL